MGRPRLLSEAVPLVVMATRDRGSADSMLRYEKTLQLMREMQARQTPMIAVATEGDETVTAVSRHVIYVPESNEQLAPVFEVIPLQMLAYCTAVRRGIDVDRPRNLVKAVVEE